MDSSSKDLMDKKVSRELFAAIFFALVPASSVRLLLAFPWAAPSSGIVGRTLGRRRDGAIGLVNGANSVSGAFENETFEALLLLKLKKERRIR